MIVITVESSEPEANASPDGWNLTLFTSDSWPSKIWTYWPVRMSQTSATWSDPLKKRFFIFWLLFHQIDNRNIIIKLRPIGKYCRPQTARCPNTWRPLDVLETLAPSHLSRRPTVYKFRHRFQWTTLGEIKRKLNSSFTL